MLSRVRASQSFSMISSRMRRLDIPRMPPPSVLSQRDEHAGRAQPYRERGPSEAPRNPWPPLPPVVLSVVYVPGRSASVDQWSGEATKRVEIHQGRYPRRGAAAVEMGASCCFSSSRPSAASPSDPASRRELRTSHRSSANHHPARLFLRFYNLMLKAEFYCL